jgi:nucleoside-diphosphate-sugar epimerase
VKVFVFGGTGAIGGHAVPALLAAGHQVSALARAAKKAAILRGQGAEPVMVSRFNRAALAEAFRGYDAVVNLATSIPPMSRFTRRRAWRANHGIRIEGSAAVVDAALAAGVGRLLQESVSLLCPDGGATWIDEDVPADPFPIARGNLAAGPVRSA